MTISLEFTLPSGDIGFVEDKRAFCVQGIIQSDTKLKEDTLLRIELINSKKEIVRFIECDRKNKDIYRYFDGLTTYKEELDRGREKLSEFGFPELVVDDINKPLESIRKATIKAWYNDTCFKGIFINASNVEHGALLDDGMDFVDENGKSYSLLEKGKYTIKASLYDNGKKLCSKEKKIVIGQRKNQLIYRFNPVSHKERMISWGKENDFSENEDLMPGYLESYLGKWYYHLGLLTMYRANDICMYEKANIKMFIYLIDKTSTSYETELAYLQSKEALKDNKRFTYYHYDIGEAVIGERKAKILEFKEDEDIYLCRIDILNKKINDNVYYLDRRDVKGVIFDFENVEVDGGSDIAVMGIVKPKQMDKNDFVLRKDNTYEIKNYPYIMRYTFYIDEDKFSIDKYLNMERIDDESIGTSVYEFYNTIHIDEEMKGKEVKVLVESIDYKGNISTDFKKFKIKVK